MDRTQYNYTCMIRQFIKYVSVTLKLNPFYHPINTNVVIFFLMNKLRIKKTNSWNTEISALLWFSEIIDSNKLWRISSHFKNVYSKVKKLYFISPKKANPIFISLVLKYLNILKFDIKKAQRMSLFELSKILIIQLSAITGMRCMEIMRYNNKRSKNGILIKYINIFYLNSQLNVLNPNYLTITIPPGMYKNAISRTESKTIIVGDTYDMIFNPFRLLILYLKKLKQIALKSNRILSNNDYLFNDEYFNPICINHTKNWLKEFYNLIFYKYDPNIKYTWHGFRSGLATWLRQLGLPIELICKYVGWSTNFLISSSYGYIRYSNYELAIVARKALLFKPKKPINFVFN